MESVSPISNLSHKLHISRQNRLNQLSHVMGNEGLSLEEKLRRAIRAAKTDDTPLAFWRKVLPTIPEGVSTTRANEMFCWARSLILEQERMTCTSEAEARQNTADRLLMGNVY